jgi:protein involved in polysaccharide export with SLBB domain
MRDLKMNRTLLFFTVLLFIKYIPSQVIDLNNYPLYNPETLQKTPYFDDYKDFTVLRERSYKSQKPSSALSGFDSQIDENTYILGTGDGFTIYLWGNKNDEIEAIIDQEGNLIIPTVGVINIKNLSLREGKQQIIEKVQSAYKDAEISVVLTSIRKFKIYILGEVKFPGFYEVNGATRVSDLIEIADGFKDDSTFRLRGIEIENESHPKQFADLALFYHSNIITSNPYLLEGDRVFVPKRKDIISVFGGVNYAGLYTLMPNDSLVTVLNAAGGLSHGADSSKILVYRFVNDVDSLVSYELSFLDSSVFYFKAEKDDRILVCNIPDYRIHRQVTILGEVRFPGVYPIQKYKTRLAEVIAMAGGLTEDAFLKGSKIIRRRLTRFDDDREFQRLRRIPLENLTPLERSYLKTKMTEENGRVSMDFEELMDEGGDLYNIILRDNDEITIAKKNLSIKVTGAVILPGLVSYKDGADYKSYINQAGGYNDEARKRSVTIIKGGSGIWLKPHEVGKLEAGDAIWVPEKPYINRFQVTKDVLLIVSSVATVVLSGIAIQSAFK